MPETTPRADVDVTKDWQATQGQKSAATHLRIFAAIAWIIAIGGEIDGHRRLVYITPSTRAAVGLLLGIWSGSPSSRLPATCCGRPPTGRIRRVSDSARFFFQNQLGAIITLIAFLPLIVLIFMDKDMDPKNKKIAGGAGVVLAIIAALIWISYHPPSVEQYTKDMNSCAAEIKAGQPTKDCSPEVAEQAKAIAQDTATVTDATKTAANPAGQDVVYWIAPENGAKKSASPQCLPHLPGCQSAGRQDGEPRIGHGSLCRKRDAHHQADRNGAEAVRIHGREVSQDLVKR